MEVIHIRLVSINIFSAYFGDLDKKKKRTILLREDAGFLFKEYHLFVRYCDNDFCKSLNIECNENAQEIATSINSSDGYPVISIPFNFSSYQELSDNKKKIFWIEEVEKVFNFIFPLMNCKSNKITEFMNYLNLKYKD